MLTGAPEMLVETTQPLRLPGEKRTLYLEGPSMAGWDEGEADLHEAMLPALPTQALTFSIAIVAILVGGVIWLSYRAALANLPTPTPLSVAAQNLTPRPTFKVGAPPPTNTQVMIMPTLPFPTVTPIPPTAPPTATQGPCIKKVKAGDTLYGLAYECGHQDKAIIDVILRLNNMTNANELQIGQEIQIPLPTPTGGANTGDASAQNENSGQADELEPTLPPGIQWYTVRAGSTALEVISELGITMKTLSDLNLDITFEQCDYSYPSGGPNCKVMLYEGQRLRVPAPQPTLTFTPSPSGSETPTPIPSPTVNQPFSLSPDNNTLFDANDLPIVRWGSAGALMPTEVYLVTVTDLDTGQVFLASTRDLMLQIPLEWQPTKNAIHSFSWTVTIANIGLNGTPVPSGYTTPMRQFMWRGKP